MDVRIQIRSKEANSVQEVVVSGRDQFILGRGPSSAAPLDGPGISREHLAVNLHLAEIDVTDISANGAWINGKPLPQREKYRLKPGEVVELPDYELSFQLENHAAAPSSESSPEANPPAAISPEPTSLTGKVSAFLGTFSTLDLLMIVVALLAIVLVILYFASA